MEKSGTKIPQTLDFDEMEGKAVLGEYSYTLDAKGRVFVPAKFRDELGEDFIIARSVDKCINVYSREMWNKYVERLDGLPDMKLRGVKRFIFSSAGEVSTDSQGRIIIPQKLREYAGLLKEVTIIGMSDRAEIWDSSTFEEYNSQMDNEELISILTENGF